MPALNKHIVQQFLLFTGIGAIGTAGHYVTLVVLVETLRVAPLLASTAMTVGAYELLFFVKDYFVTHGTDSPFLDRVPVRFAIADAAAGYHVPLLVTLWAYQTYRGS